jgi:hypothetical protein
MVMLFLHPFPPGKKEPAAKASKRFDAALRPTGDRTIYITTGLGYYARKDSADPGGAS